MKRNWRSIPSMAFGATLGILALTLVYLVTVIGGGHLYRLMKIGAGIEMRSALNLTENQRKELELRWQRERDPGAATRLASYHQAYASGPEARWRDSVIWTRRAASTGDKELHLDLANLLARSKDASEVAEGIALLEGILREKNWPAGREQGDIEFELDRALKHLETTILDPHPAGSRCNNGICRVH